MAADGADPNPFEDAFVAAIAARAIMTATALGLFDLLAAGAATAEEAAGRLSLDPLGAEALLTALAAVGYVESDDAGRFSPSPPAARQLVSSSPESTATFLGAYNEIQWDALGALDETLRTGRAPAWHERPAGDPLWEPYIRGLYELSAPEHDANAALVPVEDPERLLDVAGGHGGFAMAMCRRHPRLRATVLDLPASNEVGRRIVAEQGLAERVEHSDGNAFEADLGERLDVVSAFNLLHHLSPDENRELAARLHAALRPGGVAVIGESERPAAGDAPGVGAISGLAFYAMSAARTYTADEIRAWLERAGFGEPEVHRNERSPWRIVLVARA